MLFRTSLKQTLRTPVKLIAYFLITALVVAFLCVGLNLRKQSEINIAAADAAFTTVAIPDFQAHMDYKGNLCTDTSFFDYEGYGACAAEGYDLSPIRNAAGVKNIDAARRFGACVNGAETFYGGGVDIYHSVMAHDVIRFTVDLEEAVTVYPLVELKLPITVLDSAVGLPLECYEKNLTLMSNIREHMLVDMPLPGEEARPSPPFEMGTEAGDGSFYLEPGKEYIAACLLAGGILGQGREKTATVSAIWLEDSFHAGFDIRFNAERPCWMRDATPDFQPYLPIAPYEDGFFETERGAFFQEIIDACRITDRSLNGVTTNDLAAMRPFHSGGVRISEGRAFTEEEYASGAKVCLVSDYIAELNGWQVGDTVSLSFYETEYLFGEIVRLSEFRAPAEGFFDEGEFTIVGLYAGNVIEDQNGARAYSKGNGMDSKDVILPENSVRNAPAALLSQYTTTIRLKNSEAQAFMAEMAASGLMEEQQGGYELGLTVYDQGYSLVAPGLNQLSRVSRLTLLLSAAAAGLAVLVLAVIHVLRMRREIAAMRSLGTKKRQIMAIALSGVLLVCLLGAAVGACAGHVLSAEVTERVLASAEEDAADTTFTAMMGEETAKEFTFALESEPRLALAAGGSVVAVFAVFAALLLAAELRRPPMALLGVKE